MSPRGSNTINHIGTKAREAPPWWHADLCRDHRYTRSDENQKTTILGEMFARKSTRPSARSLPGMTAVPQPGPHLAKPPPLLPYSYQLDQMGRHLRGSARPLHQLSKHLRGGMQIFVKAPPPRQPSSQPTWRYNASSAWTRVGARRGDDSWDELLCRPQ